MTWYNTGYNGVEKEKDRIARGTGPNRFWMKEGTSREVVFLDDEPFCIHEHSFRLNGKWGNTVTCIRESSDSAPCCEKLGPKSRYYVGLYTIVDLTKNTDAKGNSYQYEMKFLPAKLDTLSLIKRKKESKQSLIGARFKITRDSADHANVGNDYEFVDTADLDKLFKLATYKGKKIADLYKEAMEKPEVLKRLEDTFQLSKADGVVLPKLAAFNYFELLKPREPREVRSLVSGAELDSDSSSGSFGSTSSKPQDDDIPF